MEQIKFAKATSAHQSAVLELLDQFRTEVSRTVDPDNHVESTSARTHGAKLFKELVESKGSAVFIAHTKDKHIGILTIHRVPQIRRGSYYAEIEEMFVLREYRGLGVAQGLLAKAKEWAELHDIKSIRLESANELGRAHAFYAKAGFKEYAKAFRLEI